MIRKVILIACVAGLILAPSLCMAQDQPAALKVALVNVPKVRNDFVERQQQFDQLKQWAAAKDQVFLKLQDYLLLSDQDFQEVMTILEMPQPIPADKQTRLDELKKTSDAKLTEYVTLQAKPNRTPEENDKFKTYAEQYQRCQDTLAQYGDKARTDFEQRGTDIDTRLNTKIIDAVKQVAAAKGYSLVLSMAAVLYAVPPADDVTDAVTALLNPPGTTPPVPAAPTPAAPSAPGGAAPAPAPAPAAGGGSG